MQNYKKKSVMYTDKQKNDYLCTTVYILLLIKY